MKPWEKYQQTPETVDQKLDQSESLGIPTEVVNQATRGKYGLTEEKMAAEPAEVTTPWGKRTTDELAKREAAIQQMPQQNPLRNEPSWENFLSTTKSSAMERSAEIKDIQEEMKKGNIGYAESEYTQIGQQAGLMLDVMGNLMSEYAPDFMKKIGSDTAKFITSFDTVQDLNDWWEGLSKREKRLYGATGNIGALVGPKIKIEPVTKATAKGFSKLRERVAPYRRNEVKEKIIPDLDQKSLNRKAKGGYQEDPLESKMYDDVAALDEVKVKNTVDTNIAVLNNAIEQEAKSLRKSLVLTRKQLTPMEVQKYIDDELIDYSSTLPPSQRAVFDKYQPDFLRDFYFFVADEAKIHGGNVSLLNLLDARQRLDQLVKKNKKEKSLEPEALGFQEDAMRKMRRVINDLIDDTASNADVHGSLSRQTSYYRAIDRLSPRSAKGKKLEAETAIGKKGLVPDAINLMKRHPIATLSVGAGAGGGMFSDFFTNPYVLTGLGALAGAYGLPKAARQIIREHDATPRLVTRGALYAPQNYSLTEEDQQY